MSTLDLNLPVGQLIDQHPELLDILVELGFKPLANPSLRSSLGKVVTLRQGAKLLQLPIEHLIQTLEWNGYTLKGGTDA